MDVLKARHFIAWHMPDNPAVEGRVELIPATNFNQPDYHLARTAEEITIPAGAVLAYVTDREPDL